MKKGLLFAGLLFLCLAGASVFAGEDEWGVITIPKGSPIHLGFASVMTGDYATYGIDQKNGALLALEDHGADIHGFTVELVVEDDQCEGSPSMAIAEKFCADPLFVGLIGNACSGGSIPASQTYEKHKFTMISPASTAAEFTARGMQNVFRTCFNDAVQGKVAAEYAWNVLKLKTAAVLHDKSQYGQPIAENFKQTFESLGGKIVTIEGVTRGDKDFRPILTKIQAMNPNIVYFGGMSAEGALIMRQMREIGMSKAAFISDDGCHSVPDFIEGAGEASEGAYITFAQPASGDIYQQWLGRFTQKYGHEPIGLVPQSYDAAMVYLKALDAAAQVQADGSLTIGKKALADAIRASSFESVTGKVGFTETGDSLSKVVVDLVKERKFELASGQE